MKAIADWENADWAKSNAELALIHRCSSATVASARRRNGAPRSPNTADRGKRREVKLPLYPAFDWGRSDRDLAGQAGVVRQLIWRLRKILEIAPASQLRELGGWDGEPWLAEVKNHKTCVVCGRRFPCPPTDRRITCSPECRRERASFRHLGRSRKWSFEARRAASQRGEAPNLRGGTPAALASYEADPEGYHSAKAWMIVDPENRQHEVKNLSRWLRDRLGNDEGKKICAGIRQISAWMRGKTKRPVTSAKGWRLLRLPGNRVSSNNKSSQPGQ